MKLCSELIPLQSAPEILKNPPAKHLRHAYFYLDLMLEAFCDFYPELRRTDNIIR